MSFFRILCALSIAVVSSVSLAQDITDVEAKPYGSYTGSAIDTVDLVSGNLMLHIPLVSYPQKGTLPPLSFSVELNNAPYSRVYASDGGGDAGQNGVRYDTAPPGAVWVAPPPGSPPLDVGAGSLYQNVGAYITSSFAGGIVTGQEQTSAGSDKTVLVYSLVDPNGTTHELESDYPSSPNVYRTTDGSGYAFKPADSPNGNAYDPISQDNYEMGADSHSADYWIPLPQYGAPSITNGVRNGTVYTPTGIQYSNVFHSFPIPSIPPSEQYPGMPTNCTALTTTATDPTGNSITRSLWYWSGCPSVGAFHDIKYVYYPGFSHPSGYDPGPYYIDSVGRVIPDIVTTQATASVGEAADPQHPLNWSVPGPGGHTLTYTLQYRQIRNTNYSSSALTGDASVAFSGNNLYNGLALASITLPGFDTTNTLEQGPGQPQPGQWQFVYSPQELGQTVIGDLSFDHYTEAGWDGPRTGPDLLQVITPTGGEIDYTYTTIVGDMTFSRCSAYCHAVSTRTVKDGKGNSYLTTYTYGPYPQSSHISGCNTIGWLYAVWTKETTSYTLNNVTLSNDTVHSFCALGTATNVNGSRFKEIETQYFQGLASLDKTTGLFVATPGSSTLLKTVLTSWTSQNNIPPPGGFGQPIVNALPTQVVTTTPGGSTTEVKDYSLLFSSGRAYCYGCGTTPPSWLYYGGYSVPIYYLSPTSDTIYSGSAATGAPLRKSTTTFEFQNPQASNYLTANMVALPEKEQILDPTTTIDNALAATTYSYDDADYITGETHCKHPAQPTDQPCGDLTKTIRWLNTGENVTTTTTYAQGMPTMKTDANGNQTSLTYQCQGMYPLTVTNAASQQTSYTYDCATNLQSSAGVVTGVTDPNGNVTTYTYTGTSSSAPASSGRLTQVQYGVVATSNGSTAQSTTFLKYPSLTEVDVAQEQSPSTSVSPWVFLNSSTVYDGLGRTIQQISPAGYTVVTTYADESTRPSTVTNPSSTDSNNPSTATDGTTTYAYDALGRVVQKTNPVLMTGQSATTQQWCYDSVADVSVWPSGNPLCTAIGVGTSWVNSMDESGNPHQQSYDGVGQLMAVTEPNPSSGSMTAAGGALKTSYSYDGLGNLTKVVQSGASSDTTARTRTFTYDSLSRLTCAANPENSLLSASCPATASSAHTAGTTGYTYYPNGNLLSKTDVRGITVSYAYDSLNRLLSKTYPATSKTPASCYQYDQTSIGDVTITNPKGHLTAEWTQADGCPSPVQLPAGGTLTSRLFLGYDFMGRLTNEQQCTSSTCATPYNFTYRYDLAGHVTQANNGLGSISWLPQYDSAGRLLTVNGVAAWNDPQFPSMLFNGGSYGPAGITSWTMPGLTFKKDYDSRLRVIDEFVTGNQPTHQ